MKSRGSLEHEHVVKDVKYCKILTSILTSGVAKQFLLFHLFAGEGLCIYTSDVAAYGLTLNKLKLCVFIHVCILPSNITG